MGIHYYRNSRELLEKISHISGICARIVRESLTNQQKIPSLALEITSFQLHDEIDYLSSLLSHCGWIKGFLRKAHDLPIRKYLLDQLIYYSVCFFFISSFFNIFHEF